MGWPDVHIRVRASDLPKLREGAHQFLSNPSVQFVIAEMRKHIIEDLLTAEPHEEHDLVQSLRLLDGLHTKLTYAAKAYEKET